MRVEIYGLVFEAPRVSVHLWSPWRAAALEHRMFEAVRQVRGLEAETGPDEARILIGDPKAWRAALQAMARVLKGWQEEGDPGTERRSWRWLLEGDTDSHGYDHAGEPTSVWAFVRVSLDHGGPGEPEKGEDVDLEGFGVRIWGETGGRG